MVFALLATASSMALAAGPDLRVINAARRGDAEAVREAIRAKADVNVPQPDGATALHWAAHLSDGEMADLLIKAGANVNAVEDGGVTPLALAATNGDEAMVDRLIKAGAKPNLGKETAVLAAARSGSVPVMRLLLAAGGDANAKEPLRGQTALMWAAAEKHSETVKLLISTGADVKAKTQVLDPPQPAKPLQGQASQSTDGANRGNPAGARMATRGGPGPNGSNGYTAMLFATRAGDIDAVRALLDAGANVNDAGLDGLSALLLATHRGHTKLGMLLLEKEADAKYNTPGYTALHWAAGSWETELTVTSISPDREGEEWATVAGLREGRLDLVKALLQHGADPNARIVKTPPRVGSSKNPALPELEGATPFIVATVAGALDVMRELVTAGADVNLRTREESQMLQAAKYLLGKGADVNAVDALGNTALHYAAYHRRDTIVQLLADRGARLDVKNKWGETPLFLAETVIQFAGGGRFETGPTPTGALLRKLGATPSKPDYTLRPFYWPNIPHV
jgi:ankyrin repeat protein